MATPSDLRTAYLFMQDAPIPAWVVDLAGNTTLTNAAYELWGGVGRVHWQHQFKIYEDGAVVAHGNIAVLISGD